MKYHFDNARMEQMLRHAGVRVVSTAGHRVTLVHAEDAFNPDAYCDPLYRLLAHIEPASVRGHEHMPSIDEAKGMGLIEEEDHED